MHRLFIPIIDRETKSKFYPCYHGCGVPFLTKRQVAIHVRDTHTEEQNALFGIGRIATNDELEEDEGWEDAATAISIGSTIMPESTKLALNRKTSNFMVKELYELASGDSDVKPERNYVDHFVFEEDSIVRFTYLPDMLKSP